MWTRSVPKFEPGHDELTRSKTQPDATMVNVGAAPYVMTEERRAVLIAKKPASIERQLAARNGASWR